MLRCLAEKPSGEVFRAGDIMDVLNDGCEETDGRAILIDGWGYDRDTSKYFNPTQIGRKFRDLAKRPHIVDVGGVDHELHFERRENKSAKVFEYVMTKKVIRSDAEV